MSMVLLNLVQLICLQIKVDPQLVPVGNRCQFRGKVFDIQYICSLHSTFNLYSTSKVTKTLHWVSLRLDSPSIGRLAFDRSRGGTGQCWFGRLGTTCGRIRGRTKSFAHVAVQWQAINDFPWAAARPSQHLRTQRWCWVRRGLGDTSCKLFGLRVRCFCGPSSTEASSLVPRLFINGLSTRLRSWDGR